MADDWRRLTVWSGWASRINPPKEDQFLCSWCSWVWLNDPICSRCGRSGVQAATSPGPSPELVAQTAEWLTRYLFTNGPTPSAEVTRALSQEISMPPRHLPKLIDMMGFESVFGYWSLPADHPWRSSVD